MATICPGCGLSVEPVHVFEQSKRTRQWYRIAKCPRERCQFNIDLSECDKPGPRHSSGDKKPDLGDERRSFWDYGL